MQEQPWAASEADQMRLRRVGTRSELIEVTARTKVRPAAEQLHVQPRLRRGSTKCLSQRITHPVVDSIASGGTAHDNPHCAARPLRPHPFAAHIGKVSRG